MDYNCNRCCEWVSLDLDEPLSEIESRLLRRHLASCLRCTVFANDTRAATVLLRALPPHTVPAPIDVRGGRRQPWRLGRLAPLLAAAAAIAALTTNGLTDKVAQVADQTEIHSTSRSEIDSMRSARRQQLLPTSSSANARIRVIEID